MTSQTLEVIIYCPLQSKWNAVSQKKIFDISPLIMSETAIMRILFLFLTWCFISYVVFLFRAWCFHRPISEICLIN